MRIADIALTVLFLGMIFIVPITRAALEIRADESPQILELFGQAPTEENLRAFENDLEEYSFFEDWMRPVYQTANYFATRELGSKALYGQNGWFFYTPGVRYLVEPYFRISEPPSSQNGDPIAVMKQLQGELAAKGIRLLVVPVPGKASIYPDRLSSTAAPSEDVFENTRLLMEEMKAAGIEYVNLHDALLEARKDADARGEALYMEADTHWTGLGAKLAAEAVAKRLEEMGLKAPADPGRYVRHKVSVERRGDVQEMTRIPLQEELFATQIVDVFQVRDARTGELYEDERASQVLVLGDSFSRVFQTDAPEAAGWIANLAYELGSPVASIVNDGGASTLVRRQLAMDLEILENKKVVVWEFVERDVRFGASGWTPIVLYPGNETKTGGGGDS